MKKINTKLILVFSVLLLGACSKQASVDDAEIERRAQKIADQKIREASQEASQIQAIKIAEQQAQLESTAVAQRETIAADLSARAATVEAKRQELATLAASEKIRREMVSAEIKNYVDSLRISSLSVGARTEYSIDGRSAVIGLTLSSPAGYSVTYKGKESDYYLFEYSDSQFSLTLKRAQNDLCLASIRHLKPLAEGIMGTDGPLVLVSSSPTVSQQQPVFPSSAGLIIVKATYGADSTQRDVKDLIKSKINSGRLDFSAHSGELGGDPIFGKVKTFYIEYINQGRLVKKSFQEGSRVSLP